MLKRDYDQEYSGIINVEITTTEHEYDFNCTYTLHELIKHFRT